MQHALKGCDAFEHHLNSPNASLVLNLALAGRLATAFAIAPVEKPSPSAA
jgi:hypothetical protein